MDTLNQIAIDNLNTVDRFHFGHNMLRSTASLEQMFGQITHILEPIIKQYESQISDINLAYYSKDNISASKINLCWYRVELAPSVYLNTYFILLNPHKGAGFVNLTNDEINKLLLNGVNSAGWYLINQVDCLRDFISNQDANKPWVELVFKNILTTVIEQLFKKHESNYALDAHYVSQFNDNLTNIKEDIDYIIDNIQVQTAAQSDIQSFADYTETNSIFYIYGRNTTIVSCTSTLKINELTEKNIPGIINSKYLNTKSDVSAFFKNIFNQDRNFNMRFFYSTINFKLDTLDKGFTFLDDNYSITTQIVGEFKITYSDATEKRIIATCQAIPISKTVDSVFFVIMLYSPAYLAKTVDHIYYNDVKLICKVTGTVNDNLAIK